VGPSPRAKGVLPARKVGQPENTADDHKTSVLALLSNVGNAADSLNILTMIVTLSLDNSSKTFINAYFFYLTPTLILQHPVVTFPTPMGRVKFVLNPIFVF